MTFSRPSEKTSSTDAASNSRIIRSTRSRDAHGERRARPASARSCVEPVGDLPRRLPPELGVQEAGDVVQLVLVVRLVERDELLLDRALGEDDDRLAVRRAGRDEVDVAQPARAWLGRRGEAGGVGDAGERRGGKAEPLLAGELDLAELVADHQLLDRCEADVRRDRLDVQAVAGVGGHAAGAGVRVAQVARPPRARP